MSIQVSVIVATCDRPRLLEGTLGALAAQEVPALAWEIVVVDNGSDAATGRLVADFATKTATPVRYAREPAVGVSRARNRGLREARGEILAFTDDDVLPAPDWVAGLVSAIERWKADGVGGRILPRWEAPPPRWLTENEDLLSRLAIMNHEQSGLLELPLGRPQVWGPNMAFRRELFERVGEFDPRLGIIGKKLYRDEETDLIRRALGKGLKIAYDPALTVFHRIGPDRLRKAYFRKLFFDAGQGRASVTRLAGRPALFGAPLRLYGFPLSVPKWGALALVGHSRAFDQQLGCFWLVGQLTGYWKVSSRRAADREAKPQPSA